MHSHGNAQTKPFKKALIIGGGGISPGIALGMIAGAKAAGYQPDVVITSCGASLGAALYSAFPNPQEALRYAKSEVFYQHLKSMVKLNSNFAFSVKKNLEAVYKNPEHIPHFFEDTILNVPLTVKGLLPQEKFPSLAKNSKLIIVAARAKFGPDQQGKNLGTRPLFQEVFFTDPVTAVHLAGFESPVQKLFPYGRVEKKTKVLSGIPLSHAVRASITDPFYLNPMFIENSYFWGGAVDLFPIETGLHLADEVLVNFPSGLYSGAEDLAVFSAFGFAQSDRTKEASLHTEVKWIDASGTIPLALDPVLFAGVFINKIPASHASYSSIIQRQFQFGFQRALEAVKIQQHKNNVRTHLRTTRVGAK